MRFRPSYSLLTLLVLTALVAGGVKLWHGPHRARVGETLSPFEQALLQDGQAIGFTTNEWQYEYDYVNRWQAPRVLSITCYPTVNYYLVAVDPLEGRKYLFSEKSYQQFFSKDDFLRFTSERIYCWIQSPLKPEESAVAVEEESLNSFIVTQRGNVYELRQTYQGIHYTAIVLNKIRDPDVRTRVEQELQQLKQRPEPGT